MPITTMSSREFNQNASRVAKAVQDGPVFVTNRGKRAFVVLNDREYSKLVEKKPRVSLADALAMPGDVDIIDADFEFPTVDDVIEPADFS